MPAFTEKDAGVDWDKVARVSGLVDLALGAQRADPDVVDRARRLGQFYGHLVPIPAPCSAPCPLRTCGKAKSAPGAL